MQNQSEIETLCGYTDGYTHISSNHEVIHFYSKKEPVTKRLLVGTKGKRTRDRRKAIYIFIIKIVCTLFYHFMTDINHDLTKSCDVPSSPAKKAWTMSSQFIFKN